MVKWFLANGVKHKEGLVEAEVELFGSEQPESDAADAGIKLGEAAFVCRWRLVDGVLPLKVRHLRALGHRSVAGVNISKQHVAWASQHIDWTLYEGAKQYPDGVLIVYVDEDLRMAMGVRAFEPLKRRSANDLLLRAERSQTEAYNTGVSPEDLWVIRDNILWRSWVNPSKESGVASLLKDLCRTLGTTTRLSETLLDESAKRGFSSRDEVFLASDEYGIVAAPDHSGPVAARYVEYYDKLLESERKKASRYR